MKFSIIFGLVLAATAQALPFIVPTELESNAYVQLYQAYLDRDREAIQKFQALLELETAKYERAKLLYASNKAIPLQELQERQAAAKIAIATLEQSKIKVKESEARLAIAVSRVAAGLDVDMCN